MSNPDPKAQPVPLVVQIDDAKIGGDYINMARIHHNQTEFVVDTMYLPPQSNQARVTARLIMNPLHAKYLLRALQYNVQIYEQQFGEIQVAPFTPPEGGPIVH
jgi:hypothetical protein